MAVSAGYIVVVLSCLVGLGAPYIPDDLTIPVDHSIPRIRPLRRQLRHFEPGQTGQITVIYQTTHPDDIHIRWFRKSNELPNAEIPDHLPIEGNSRYVLKSMSINDVYAVTLKVVDLGVWEFPMSFVLVMTAGQPAIEYQLDTYIESPIPFTLNHYLDEIRWVALPMTPLTFSFHGYMSVTCIAVIDSEVQSDVTNGDELSMYRVTFQKEKVRKRKGFMSAISDRTTQTEVGTIGMTSVGQIHKSRNNYAEESGAYMTIGSRTVLPLRYYRYEVTIRVHNATKKEEGAYACSMEREQDRSFASSWVREGHPHRRPSLELLSCETNAMSKRRRQQSPQYRLQLLVGRETCVRCRAYGYPMSNLRLTKDGYDVTSDARHDVDVHVNVGDGGLPELTYTLWRPTYDDTGVYVCHAYNDREEETLKFKMEVK